MNPPALCRAPWTAVPTMILRCRRTRRVSAVWTRPKLWLFHLIKSSLYAYWKGSEGLVNKKSCWMSYGLDSTALVWRNSGNLDSWVFTTGVNYRMLLQKIIFFMSSSHVQLPHFNRSCWRPAELQDSVHDSTAEGVHPLQLAQHVRPDRGLRHLQVRPGRAMLSCKHWISHNLTILFLD